MQWRKLAVMALLITSRSVAEDFISEFEYGQMLYQNPRGVSCVPCHGDNGEGAIIARYGSKKEPKVLRGPDIRQVTEKDLRKALEKGPGVMPRYFLTDEEIRALFTYIKEAQRRALEEPEE